ncbi:uncharacterized protein PHACADRAFT_265590 [Phanerochaete carnosa HHB-10118-sp]|uniref:Uncharacterized protein n=1 Tax=Phanerochaete carnosa (strain HHB-10118-sp) TaxID=650164 RepID=K5VSW9_PHACS|nr:uncharacterized protein PHACADRAFT_265590 [Phanerochaete carnosa HHB-10118-sp]EKM49850.1 hypothetical protein PHACADRAFT_265590 [Phanerochaete carnosa HHB-10118-sp]
MDFSRVNVADDNQRNPDYTSPLVRTRAGLAARQPEHPAAPPPPARPGTCLYEGFGGTSALAPLLYVSRLCMLYMYVLVYFRRELVAWHGTQEAMNAPACPHACRFLG